MTREERWEDESKKIIEHTFATHERIIKNLTNLDIDVSQDTVTTSEGSGLFIYGPVGTGKTMYACALAIETAKQSFLSKKGIPSLLFIRSSEFLESIRKSYNQENTEPIMQMAVDANILILDDLGTEKATEWTLDMLNSLINTRYERIRCTIITSNFDLNEIADKVDDRTASRIYEMCKMRHFDGKNFRMLEKEPDNE